MNDVRSALEWAADVIAQEARHQWERDSTSIPCAQVVAQRMQVMERVIRARAISAED